MLIQKPSIITSSYIACRRLDVEAAELEVLKDYRLDYLFTRIVRQFTADSPLNDTRWLYVGHCPK
jgi:hypothetical protein